MIQPTNNVFVPAYHLCQKISYEKNLSQYTQLQSCTLHTPLYTFTYGNIYAPYWVNSKIYFIKSDHFLPWSNQKQVYSNINSKFLWPYTCWTCNQRNLIFIIFSHDIENSIESFLKWSNILKLSWNNYILIHATVWVIYCLFPHSSRVFPN